jgi:type I restriction enzyme S subunit
VGEGALLIRSQNVLDNRLSLDGVARISDGASRALAGVTVETGDVLINITGDSIARVAHVKRHIGDARVNQHVAIVRPNGLVEPAFLQKYLVSPEAKARLLSLSQGGATRKALTKAQLAQFLVPLPPLAGQQAIAEVLGALDDKIAANADLVRALGAWMICSTSQADGEPGMVSINDLAHLVKSTVSPLSFPAVHHFSLPAHDVDGLPAWERGSDIKSNKQLLKAPAVLLSKLNPRIPRVWDVPLISAGEPSLVSTEFLALEPRSVPTGALWAVLSQADAIGRMQEMARGTSGSHQRVAPADALSMTVVDARHLGGRRLNLLEAMSRRRWQAKLESRQLAELRDTLLPRLMSGRLAVRQALEGVL